MFLDYLEPIDHTNYTYVIYSRVVGQKSDWYFRDLLNENV